MEAIKVRNLSFRYPETDADVLKDISVTINQGEFVTLCGISGSGKTTLLRNFKPSLTPHGIRSGKIEVLGNDINALSLREQSTKIGYVMQSPDNQIVTDKVWHELAFGLESLGNDSNTIRKRVAETADFFGISKFFECDVKTLSGGQKQILNLASIMAMQPEILILDEPTSQLDPIAASEFLSCVAKINRELGTTVIITEHRLEEIIPASDKVIVIEDGKIISCDSPQNTGVNLKSAKSKCFKSLPAPMRIWHAVEENDNKQCPVTITQGREWLKEFCNTHKTYQLYQEQNHTYTETTIELKNINFRYSKNSADILKGLNFTAHRGELITILGGNGAGKSTLLSIINQTEKPYSGKVNVTAKCLTLPQNPQVILGGKTVLHTLKETFDNTKISKEEQNKRLNRIIELLSLSPLLNRHPFDLSGGEQQKTAFAKLLLLNPSIILLDEPTKGLDAESKEQLAKIINTLTNSGTTVVMVSHDVEFCAKFSHRCMLMFNGEIIASDSPRMFFASNSFYVTSSNRMARGIIDEAVTPEDVFFCCTGKKEQSPDIETIEYFKTDNNSAKELSIKPKLPLWKIITAIFGFVLLIAGVLINTEVIKIKNYSDLPFLIQLSFISVPLIILMISLGSISKKPLDNHVKAKLPKRTIAAAIMVLAAIPLTIFIGTAYLNDQKFLFISLLVLFECMLPFFLVFEGRKPQARELVIIAVLCALAITGRSVFAMLPQIKPVVALIIIAGVSFGGESGFIVGAMTMLVSNIYFGQGAWTPWQMFAAGLIGFLSGILFQKGLLNTTRAALSVFGFIVTILIYGGIMNFSTVILTRAPINYGTLAAYYAQGLPMDIIHALSTFVILWFISEPMLEKLGRIKTKYGLMK